MKLLAVLTNKIRRTGIPIDLRLAGPVGEARLFKSQPLTGIKKKTCLVALMAFIFKCLYVKCKQLGENSDLQSDMRPTKNNS